MAVNANELPPQGCFEEWWNTEGAWVEAPNERRGGYSGVQLVQRGAQTLYCKRQANHPYYSWRHPLGEPTIFREARASMALQTLGIEVPHIVFYGARKRGRGHQALLVTENLQGFVSLDEWYARSARDCSDAVQEQVMAAIGRMLARMHRGRWQHGCLYPKHIFVRVKEQDNVAVVDTALLDLEKSRQRLFARSAARRDLWQLYRHRETMPDAHWQRLITSYRERIADRFRLAASDRKRLQCPSS